MFTPYKKTLLFTFTTPKERDHFLYLFYKAKEMTSRRQSMLDLKVNEEFTLLLPYSKPLTFAAGTKIISEGSLPLGVYQITSGLVRIEKDGVKMATIEEGRFFSKKIEIF